MLPSSPSLQRQTRMPPLPQSETSLPAIARPVDSMARMPAAATRVTALRSTRPPHRSRARPDFALPVKAQVVDRHRRAAGQMNQRFGVVGKGKAAAVEDQTVQVRQARRFRRSGDGHRRQRRDGWRRRCREDASGRAARCWRRRSRPAAGRPAGSRSRHPPEAPAAGVPWSSGEPGRMPRAEASIAPPRRRRFGRARRWRATARPRQRHRRESCVDPCVGLLRGPGSQLSCRRNRPETGHLRLPA